MNKKTLTFTYSQSIKLLQLVGFIFIAGLARSQTIEDSIHSSDIASAYASIINFASEPDISSSKLEIKDRSDPAQMHVTKFPLRHEFKLKDSDKRPVVQATLAKLKLRQTVVLDAPPPFPELEENSIIPKWTSYSITLGGGIRIPISKHWSILPAIDGGYARLENDAAYNGSFAEALRPLVEGKLTDWEADAWLANVHLTTLYTNQYKRLNIDLRLSGTISHIESYDATSDLQEFSETIGTANIKFDVTQPLKWNPKNYPLSVVWHAGNSTIVTNQRNDLGFSSVFDAGASLKADIQHLTLPVTSIAIGGKVLFGNNVTGWSLITSYRF